MKPLWMIISGGAASWMSAGPGVSAPLALGTGAFTGWAISRALEPRFERSTVLLTIIALMGSAPVAAQPDVARTLLALAAGSALLRLCAARPGATGLIFASAAGMAPAIMALAQDTERGFGWEPLLAALFGARGLIYGAPILWLAFGGLVRLRGADRPLARLALAAVGPGLLTLSMTIDPGERALWALWVPFLAPGLARALEGLRSFAARRPERVLAGAGACLILWNVLLMEQYRRLAIPADDTTSFARITMNSASLLSRAVGAPPAWPANWIFAWRFGAPASKWEAVAGRSVFSSRESPGATVEFGDDPSPIPQDAAFLLEGFGAPRTCEKGWCRDLYDAGRLLVPLAGRRAEALRVVVKVRGEGVLRLEFDGAVSNATPLSEFLADIALDIPSRAAAPGIHVLSLAIEGGGRATLDRITLFRMAPSGSAR